jgi:hypothetical protein
MRFHDTRAEARLARFFLGKAAADTQFLRNKCKKAGFYWGKVEDS